MPFEGVSQPPPPHIANYQARVVELTMPANMAKFSGADAAMFYYFE